MQLLQLLARRSKRTQPKHFRSIQIAGSKPEGLRQKGGGVGFIREVLPTELTPFISNHGEWGHVPQTPPTYLGEESATVQKAHGEWPTRTGGKGS